MINRGAVLLKYGDPAIRWINDTDPYDEDPGIARQDLHQDRTVYLMSPADADGDAAVRRWIELNYQALFESELSAWYTDPELWPEPRTLATFDEWFGVEYHSMIVDTVDGEIQDEEI
jgi:hypothetical protein